MNAFENLVDALAVVRSYAKESHDENLRQFANAVLCGNDTGKSAEFWLQDIPDIELYYKRKGIPFPIHRKKQNPNKSICISTTPITMRRT